MNAIFPKRWQALSARLRLPAMFYIGVALTSGGGRGEELAEKLTPLMEKHPGQVAVAVQHLQTGEAFSHRGDQPMPTASLIKVAVMVEAYRQAADGMLDLDKPLTLRAEDKVPGSGILTPHFSAGATLTLRDAIRLMIAFSDNTATNLVLDQIGLKATAETMERLGFPNTKIHAKVFRRDTSVFPELSQRFGLGATTADEMLRLLAAMHDKSLVSPAACEAMLEHLRCCEDKSKLARHLPPEAKFAHKTGAVTGVRTDAGILQTASGPIAICMLTSENRDSSGPADKAAEDLCAEIGRIVFEHFQATAFVRAAPAAEPLRIGASGDLVKWLQRTLNARLQPSPNLGLDGEFGAATEAAVIRFQKELKLEASGAVGPETWQALGVLATEEPPLPDPQAANAQVLEKSPPDELDGPPLVTCKAWAIADGRTGKLIAGSHENDRLNIASTTKIMTAFVVLSLAKEQPAILDEVLTFSARADETAGSTADIRGGEKLPVREALFGLLLPSGNDASVALAEHFGCRFPPADAADASEKSAAGDDPLPRFIAEMNRTAERLGMKDSRYANPHGMTEKVHRSTVADQLRLAHAAMQLDSFRGYVSTRQHGCTVTGSGGYQRHVLWKNTNQLLPIAGFDGIKTGTTDAAGACLVSRGIRDDDSLLLCVLGSTSSDARYVDSRNLYRWAWQQRQRQPSAP